ncbi:hypothetical protein ACEQPO_25645 [Bacillus sp. SL00103]
MRKRAAIHLRTFRPPYGGTNQDINQAVGMKVSLWDVDPEDWKIRNSQQITNHVLSHAKMAERY